MRHIHPPLNVAVPTRPPIIKSRAQCFDVCVPRGAGTLPECWHMLRSLRRTSARYYDAIGIFNEHLLLLADIKVVVDKAVRSFLGTANDTLPISKRCLCLPHSTSQLSSNFTDDARR